MLRILAAVLIIWSGCESGGGGGCSSTVGGSDGNDPVIDNMSALPASVIEGATTTVTVVARDLDGEALDYIWTNNGGTFQGTLTEPSIIWKAPNALGIKTVTVKVRNESGNSVSRSVNIEVTNIPTPIVIIDSPANGDYIPASTGNVLIHATIPNTTDVDSAKFFINNVLLGKLTNHSQTPQYPWDVTALNGTKTIKVQAWTNSLAGGGVTTTDSSTVQVHIEGTIGKH